MNAVTCAVGTKVHFGAFALWVCAKTGCVSLRCAAVYCKSTSYAPADHLGVCAQPVGAMWQLSRLNNISPSGTPQVLTHHVQHMQHVHAPYEAPTTTRRSLQAPVDQDLAQQQAVPPAKMLVPQLKEQLKTFNMPVSGRKADLVHRLETALAAAAATGHASDAVLPNAGAADSASAVQQPGAASPEAAALREDADDARLEQEAGARQDAAGPAGAGLDQDGGLAHEPVGGVQPGTQDLGDIVTAEVSRMLQFVCLIRNLSPSRVDSGLAIACVLIYRISLCL